MFLLLVSRESKDIISPTHLKTSVRKRHSRKFRQTKWSISVSSAQWHLIFLLLYGCFRLLTIKICSLLEALSLAFNKPQMRRAHAPPPLLWSSHVYYALQTLTEIEERHKNITKQFMQQNPFQSMWPISVTSLVRRKVQSGKYYTSTMPGM